MLRLASHPPVAIALSLLFIAGGCSGGDSSATEAVSLGSVTTGPTPSAAACAALELPSGPSTRAIAADVDGDAIMDIAYTVQTDTAWEAVVEFGGGGAATSPLSGSNTYDEARMIGPADLDGDGRDELAVMVGSGAYVLLIGFVRARDCELLQLLFEDSSPAVFATGASVGGGEALLCNGDGTLERFFFNLLPGSDLDGDEAAYEAGFEPFRIVDELVVPLPGDGAVLTESEVLDMELFDCLGLELSL